jgi:hypothetical protein
MQIKLTIALVAAIFALASFPAFAADMPADGTKNFTAPGDAPSYFTNEAVPPSARVANQATFTELEEEVAPAPSYRKEKARGGKRASARKSSKHASGKSKGRGGSTYYMQEPLSKSIRAAAAPNSGTRSVGAAKVSGKTWTPAGGSKANSTKPGTKPAKSGIGQNAAATAATSFA